MIESIMLVTIMLTIGLFLVFRHLCSFIDSYHGTMKDSLGMHQLAMDNIKALTNEIEQMKKEQ
jgi:hypothetical protein